MNIDWLRRKDTMEIEQSQFSLSLSPDNPLSLSLDNLAILARDDGGARELLYARLMPEMRKGVVYYRHRVPSLDESECYYGLYLATERAIRKFDPLQTSFLRYWATCASRALFKCTSHARFENRITDLEEIPTEDDIREDNIFIERYFRRVRESEEEVLGNIIMILKCASYAVEEIALMLGIGHKEIKMQVRNTRRRMRIFARTSGLARSC